VFAKKLEVGLKAFYGDGTGRFGSAQLADATARPDGTLALIRGGHWLGSLDWHVRPKFDLYGYVAENTPLAQPTWDMTRSRSPSRPPFQVVAPQGSSRALVEGVQPAYPALTTTSIATNGIGGYGSPYANNSGCSTETLRVPRAHRERRHVRR